MSALGDVRFGSEADVPAASHKVYFWTQSGHSEMPSVMSALT